MLRFLKWFGIIILSLVLLLLIAGFFISESRPEANATPEADELAQKMMTAVNTNAWDSTGVIQWTFAGMHDFLWDRKRHYVQVSWDNNKVLLDVDNFAGKVYVDEQEQTEEEAYKYLEKARHFFYNDGFWLNPIAKAFDPGTERSIVEVKDGRKGLMVHYTSGGITPGDAYVWFLDENNRPTSWKMWVNIIPIGGVEVSWEEWQSLETGAMVATLHKAVGVGLPVTNIKAAKNLEEFGFQEDPFDAIVQKLQTSLD